MPTFDFHCAACQHNFEFMRPFGSVEVPKCPKCGKAKTKKLITPPTIHFKGTGFYATDSVAKKPEKKKPGKKKKDIKKSPKTSQSVKQT